MRTCNYYNSVMALLNLFNIKFPTIEDKIRYIKAAVGKMDISRVSFRVPVSAASYPSAKAFPQNGVYNINAYSGVKKRGPIVTAITINMSDFEANMLEFC